MASNALAILNQSQLNAEMNEKALIELLRNNMETHQRLIDDTQRHLDNKQIHLDDRQRYIDDTQRLIDDAKRQMNDTDKLLKKIVKEQNECPYRCDICFEDKDVCVSTDILPIKHTFRLLKRKVEGDNYTDSCNCRILICNDCVKRIRGICPTCRTTFNKTRGLTRKQIIKMKSDCPNWKD